WRPCARNRGDVRGSIRGRARAKQNTPNGGECKGDARHATRGGRRRATVLASKAVRKARMNMPDTLSKKSASRNAAPEGGALDRPGTRLKSETFQYIRFEVA